MASVVLVQSYLLDGPEWPFLTGEELHPHPLDDPLRDPRVRIQVKDGRFFLQVTDQRFDLITGEPPAPKTAGIVYLSSQESFQLVHDRLTDRGVATSQLGVRP